MAASGKEPVGSMGNDAALAVLSDKPQLLFNYFKQLFAQVTNPPIDPIREELVMSLTTYIGNRGNILAETPAHARLIKLNRPVLTDDELLRLERAGQQDFQSRVLTMEFPAGGDGAVLALALENLAHSAVEAVRENCRILVLSDRNLSEHCVPIPSLLAVAAVNRALIAAGLRPEAGLIVQSGEVREIMHFALLVGFGATAVNPYLALESVTALARSGAIAADPVTAAGNYIHAVDKGLLISPARQAVSAGSGSTGLPPRRTAALHPPRFLRLGTGKICCRTADSTVSARTGNSICGRRSLWRHSVRRCVPTTGRHSTAIPG